MLFGGSVANEESWKKINQTGNYAEYGNHCTDSLTVPGGTIYRMRWITEGKPCMTSAFVPDPTPLLVGSFNAGDPSKTS
jgi:hypothetical protein